MILKSLQKEERVFVETFGITAPKFKCTVLFFWLPGCADPVDFKPRHIVNPDF